MAVAPRKRPYRTRLTGRLALSSLLWWHSLPYHAAMPSVPNFKKAILDIRKIEDYCLNPIHPRGRHKARVFREALGVDQADAEWLRAILLQESAKGRPVGLESDEFGGRWRIDVAVSRHGRDVVVRTVWIVRPGEDAPRFLTCWVL